MSTWDRDRWARELDGLGDDAALGALDVLHEVHEQHPELRLIGREGQTTEELLEQRLDDEVRRLLRARGRCELRTVIRHLTALQAERNRLAEEADLEERHAIELAHEHEEELA